MQLKGYKKIKKDLERASKEKDAGLRGVKIASIISEALHSIGGDPVLVGGSAVTFYTDGRYTTRDIDMVVVGGKTLEGLMLNLGFKKYGKDYVCKKLKIYIEFPGESLGGGEISCKIEIEGRELRIISIEDLIVDRLCAFKFWKSEIDGVNALILLELGKDDRKRTEKRARQEDVLDALDHILWVYNKVVRERLPQKKANKLLTDFLY